MGYFIYLGRTNPVDCAAEYFRSVFPEDEEISSHLTLNGRTGPGGCKLRDSRFAQACQGKKMHRLSLFILYIKYMTTKYFS